MDRDKYIMIYISMIRQEIVEKYNPPEKVHNVYIYARVSTGMYGLPKAGLKANYGLVKHLETYG